MSNSVAEIPFAGASQTAPCLAVLAVTLCVAVANACACQHDPSHVSGLFPTISNTDSKQAHSCDDDYCDEVHSFAAYAMLKGTHFATAHCVPQADQAVAVAATDDSSSGIDGTS